MPNRDIIFSIFLFFANKAFDRRQHALPEIEAVPAFADGLFHDLARLLFLWELVRAIIFSTEVRFGVESVDELVHALVSCELVDDHDVEEDHGALVQRSTQERQVSEISRGLWSYRPSFKDIIVLIDFRGIDPDEG